MSAWELVRSALPRNDNGSRIITTTRIEAVAKSCCTGIAAQMYQAKPLVMRTPKDYSLRGYFCPVMIATQI